MKLKTLRKRIRRLEARLQSGAKKLAKLKRKLGTATTASVAKAKKKSSAPARKAGKTAKSSTKTKKRRRRSAAKPAGAKKPSVAKKVKKKRNFSPQRRAQLAAAMKARWAAKRVAAEPNSQLEGQLIS